MTTLKIRLSGDVTWCRFVDSYQYFGEDQCRHLYDKLLQIFIDFFSLKVEALRSSETSTRPNIRNTWNIMNIAVRTPDLAMFNRDWIQPASVSCYNAIQCKLCYSTAVFRISTLKIVCHLPVDFITFKALVTTAHFECLAARSYGLSVACCTDVTAFVIWFAYGGTETFREKKYLRRW